MARPASPGPEPRRLLVVEDQESLSVIVEGTALNCCWPPPSDVVLLDCVLPGETMWQFVLEGDRQQVPVVLMTGDPARMKEARAGERPSSSSRLPWRI